ncbi:MAG: fumarate reductase/succinate dehydrogenase flavoprotein subunit, partial [Dehalococcoidia bacterium]
LHKELQDTMQVNVGIIRNEADMTAQLSTIADLKERATRLQVEGNVQYNPGWHLALDLQHMVLLAEAMTLAAIERKESRGGHTRDDFPGPSAEFGKVNVVVRQDSSGLSITQEPLAEMPDDLQALFEE